MKELIHVRGHNIFGSDLNKVGEAFMRPIEAQDNIANINHGFEDRARGGMGNSGNKGRKGLLGGLIPSIGDELESYLHKFWNDLTDIVTGYLAFGIAVTVGLCVLSLIIAPCASGGLNSQACGRLGRFLNYKWREFRFKLHVHGIYDWHGAAAHQNALHELGLGPIHQ